MSARVANITFHAADPAGLARFWCAVMGYPAWSSWPDDEVDALREWGMSDEEIASTAEAWDGDPSHQRFYFSRYGRGVKQHRNRMHVDVTPFADRRASRQEVERFADELVGLGASIEKVLTEPWGPFEEFAIMMRDPEGNEFCVQ